MGPFSPDERLLVRQAYSGLCWSKQFYYFDGQTMKPGELISDLIYSVTVYSVMIVCSIV